MLNDILNSLKSFQEFENTNNVKSNQLKYYNNLNLMFTSINYLIETINSNYEGIFLEEDDQFTKVKKIEKVMRIFMLYIKLVENLEEKMSEAPFLENSEDIINEFEKFNTNFNDSDLKNKKTYTKPSKAEPEKKILKLNAKEEINEAIKESEKNEIEEVLNSKDNIEIKDLVNNSTNTIKSNSFDLKKQLKIKKNINLNKNRKKKNKKPNLK